MKTSHLISTINHTLKSNAHDNRTSFAEVFLFCVISGLTAIGKGPVSCHGTKNTLWQMRVVR